MDRGCARARLPVALRGLRAAGRRGVRARRAGGDVGALGDARGRGRCGAAGRSGVGARSSPTQLLRDRRRRDAGAPSSPRAGARRAGAFTWAAAARATLAVTIARAGGDSRTRIRCGYTPPPMKIALDLSIQDTPWRSRASSGRSARSCASWSRSTARTSTC